MIAFLVRAGFKMLALAALTYVTFFVPIGPRTLYGHMSRIAATREARELSSAISLTVETASSAVASRFATAGNQGR
jgi:hypothetical protein